MTQPPAIATTPVPALVTVIIVNFNGGDMIGQCLAALARQSFRDFVTVVVDNNSSDGSVAAIRAQHPQVEVLALAANAGFAGGVNHALRTHAPGPLVALLNPDAFPAVDWLENLVAAAGKHSEFATFGSRMYSDTEQQHLDGVGDAYHVSGLPWRQGHGCRNTDQHNHAREIFAPCAAAALYRRSALDAVGLLDEEYFLYVEDVDLGFRLRLAGYRALYVPQASIQHIGSAFVGRNSDFQVYHGHRNLVWVFVKNMPGVLFWLFLPLHIALNLVTLVWFSLRGKGSLLWRAKRDAIRGIPHYWTKRQAVQTHRKASVWAILRQLSWNPFSRCA
ncbi:glycosyltransferase family 2 protein [Rhodoferax sp. AJA081-3]|uniref:glycosyltransferase family 2 protein n=1 Tax=Rhodoferax sp. AJA081-3 TaxID=2752316 RepID=UPI001ADFA94E|nr:glycosyltransferase family 2 protein [Rhodoferax sp. AJA081-3]QTN26122.1 glycosyltransferase family 2 protein [Rhodoferax sp. AJA081-3]